MIRNADVEAWDLSGNQYFGKPAHLSSAQARCDSIQADYRAEGQRRSIRRDPPPVPAALIPTDDDLKLRLAEELDFARRRLDAMGDELTGDMGLVLRHAVALQSFDIVGQMLGHISDVIRSSDPAGAVQRIGMSDLKGRLLRHRL